MEVSTMNHDTFLKQSQHILTVSVSVTPEVPQFITRQRQESVSWFLLKLANFQANSVLSCFFPSSSQQLQDLKI